MATRDQQRPTMVRLDGRALLAVPVPLDLRRLREIEICQPDGPRPAPGGAERPGDPPGPDHPWPRPESGETPLGQGRAYQMLPGPL